MDCEPGQKLIAFLRRVEISSEWSVVADVTDRGSSWQLAGSTWKARVIVDPQRWIGLAFEVGDPIAGRQLSYEIDTDLYDIGHGHREFAHEIESDILGFLENLQKGRILRSGKGRKIVLFIPKDGAFIRVVKGRLPTRSERGGPGDGEEYVTVV